MNKHEGERDSSCNKCNKCDSLMERDKRIADLQAKLAEREQAIAQLYANSITDRKVIDGLKATRPVARCETNACPSCGKVMHEGECEEKHYLEENGLYKAPHGWGKGGKK